MVLVIILTQLKGGHTVTPNYLHGANLWLQSKDLYDGTGGGFIYLPQAAILFLPFVYLAKFSFLASEIVWRLVSLSLLFWGVLKFTRLVNAPMIGKMFLVVTVVTLPLIFSSARNGQFNIIIAALMLLAVCAIAEDRYNLAAFTLILGLALKPVTIVLLLLLGALYRKLVWRLLVGLVVILLFPFLTQKPAYVLMQYLNTIVMLKQVATLGAVGTDWAHFFSLLRQFNLVINERIQNLIRGLVAIFVLFCGYKAQKKYTKNQTLIILYTLASCYLMLFNPRTENNNYGMITPALGLFIFAFYMQGAKLYALLLLMVFVGLSFAGHFTFIIGSGNRECWSAPFFAVIFFMVILQEIFHKRNSLMIKPKI